MATLDTNRHIGPRERLRDEGVSSLTDQDLIAIILSPGANGMPSEMLAKELLRTYGPLNRLLIRRTAELADVKGIGLAKACRLIAALELGRRAAEQRDADPVIATFDDVCKRWARLSSEPEEVFVAIGVNNRNRILGEWVVARGCESGINLNPRKVFTLLMKERVSRVVFVHNHPSGDPTPSAEDLMFTRRLLESARLLDITVLDHVIIASGGSASLRSYMEME